MINIPQAIRDGRVKDNGDGTFTVHDEATFHDSRPATEADVLEKRAFVVGACVSLPPRKQRVERVIDTLTADYNHGDRVSIGEDEYWIWNIKSNGDCDLEPVDPMKSETVGNIYQLERGAVTAVKLKN